MGRLDVRVIGCKNLPEIQTIGKIDPYVVVKIKEGSKTEAKDFKTKAAENTENPVYDEIFKVTVADPDTAQVEFKVWNSNTLSDDFLAEYSLNIAGLVKGEKKTGWYLLKNCKNPSAEIGIELLAIDFGHEPAATTATTTTTTPAAQVAPTNTAAAAGVAAVTAVAQQQQAQAVAQQQQPGAVPVVQQQQQQVPATTVPGVWMPGVGFVPINMLGQQQGFGFPQQQQPVAGGGAGGFVAPTPQGVPQVLPGGGGGVIGGGGFNPMGFNIPLPSGPSCLPGQWVPPIPAEYMANPNEGGTGKGLTQCRNGHELQPVGDYDEKQITLWCDCCFHKVFPHSGGVACRKCDVDLCARCQKVYRKLPPKPKCPAGHDLNPANDPAGKWGCDVCHKDGDKNGSMRCKKCSGCFDICSSCYAGYVAKQWTHY